MRQKIRRTHFVLSLHIIFLFAIFVSCGIDDYVYLSPVPEAPIRVTFNNTADIPIPSNPSGEALYFTHFAIYYRIYISNLLLATETPVDDLGKINPALQADYNSIRPYSTANTSTTTSSSASIGNILGGRGYYELELEAANIRDIITPGSTLTISMQPSGGVRPTLSVGGVPYTLYRSDGEGKFTHLPLNNHYFNNTPELYNNDNVTSNQNLDVAKNASSAENQYTYVSLYIVKVGIDSTGTYAYVYSTPTFIGILSLSNEN
jgi:hypothetical protein